MPCGLLCPKHTADLICFCVIVPLTLNQINILLRSQNGVKLPELSALSSAEARTVKDKAIGRRCCIVECLEDLIWLIPKQLQSQRVFAIAKYFGHKNLFQLIYLYNFLFCKIEKFSFRIDSINLFMTPGLSLTLFLSIRFCGPLFLSNILA